MKKILLILWALLGLTGFGPSAWGLNRFCTLSIDPAIDVDRDCVNNDAEVDQFGTDPNNPDSDADGVFDGDELNGILIFPFFASPPTNPLDSDTDGDNLSDGLEIELSLPNFDTNIFPQRFDPTLPDTDGDGILDYFELFSTCGNGIREGQEACDDGNLASGDGCNALCLVESCGNGIVEGAAGETCDDGNLQSGDGCGNDCRLEIGRVCGDGIAFGSEQCDDGNLVSGDGCSAFCFLEIGLTCGDGISVAPQEECDDGNTEDGDGCSADCALEGVECGDGIRAGVEECDDGNIADGDGCDGDCRLEAPVFCGDGIVQGSQRGGTETCDDGNTTDGDGCDASCRSESCGDGIVQREGVFFEECDDGNTVDDDACDSLCQVNPDFIPPGQPGQSPDGDEVQGAGGCSLQGGGAMGSPLGAGCTLLGLGIALLRFRSARGLVVRKNFEF